MLLLLLLLLLKQNNHRERRGHGDHRAELTEGRQQECRQLRYAAGGVACRDALHSRVHAEPEKRLVLRL
ncbi:MAG: hypothetical protein ACK6D2_19620 [Planctomycetota bacterium]